jgi:hypothetical protein
MQKEGHRHASMHILCAWRWNASRLVIIRRQLRLLPQAGSIQMATELAPTIPSALADRRLLLLLAAMYACRPCLGVAWRGRAGHTGASEEARPAGRVGGS